MALYIAHEEITSEKKIDDVYTEITLKNLETGKERVVTFTQKLLPYLVTEEVSDLSVLREESSKPIIRDILKVLLDYSPKVNDMKYIFENVMANMNKSMSIADDKKWGLEYEERRVHDYHLILMEGASESQEIPSGK